MTTTDTDPPAFVLHVQPDDVDRWRQTLGQADINAWCDAHGLDPCEVLVDGVVVYGWDDGGRALLATVYARDSAGRIQLDHTGDAVRTHELLLPLHRSLPEGIGQVVRADQPDTVATTTDRSTERP